MTKFPFYYQHDSMDCGPTCLRMIAQYHGKYYSLQWLRENSYIDREGVSLRGILEAAERIGFRATAVKMPFYSDDNEELEFSIIPLPCIVHWKQNHFVVAYKYSKKHVWVADPEKGKYKLDHKTFQKYWVSDYKEGIALLLETTPDFFTQEEEIGKKGTFSLLLNYLLPYKKLILQLTLGLLLASLFQLIFPFLTQSIVDIGIQNQNIGFIQLILIAQLMVFAGQVSVNLLQSWILLHISTRVNVSLMADFLIKLMKLPIGFFDTKMVGDLLQRIGDHTRIEAFLTGSTLNVLFSVINLVVFGLVLFIYNSAIFFIFLLASVAYFLWIILFLNKRKEVDYQRFAELSANQSTLIELIQGMPEIKLQNSEYKHRRTWTNIQAKLFKANIRSLTITQYQDTGAIAINRLKDIFITFVAAKAVVEGTMTLGMMLAIQYIVGQLNAPLAQMVGFIRTAQDAKLSLERLNEIHEQEDEVKEGGQLEMLPPTKDLVLEEVDFRYNELEENVLKNINLTIPAGKVTAIVGTSGSGKTTLVKLLLGFYQPQKGQIKLGKTPLYQINKRVWRDHCGAVMQDGYIFSDTIAKNVAESEESVNKTELLKAVKIANIQEFVEGLPLNYNTNIGAKGNGISQGQKQRLLIARAVYKNPDFLFFDEATNALDSKNERIIVENLNQFFEGKTVVTIAHRLSTVKKADQIIVLEKGEVKELGTHQELVANKSLYYRLIKDQLELGN